MQSLKAREYTHRSKYNKASSKYIPPYIDWEIKPIEECEESQGALREQYWYDTLKPLYNRCRPGQTHEEALRNYRQTEAGKEAQRRYNQSEGCKESQRKHNQSEGCKEARHIYAQSEARKEAQRRYREKKKAKLNLTDKENEPRGLSE